MKFYEEYSNFVKGVDFAFLFIMAISILFLIVLTIVIIVFVIKYNKKRNPKPTQIKDNYALEITWTVIPLIIVLAMFYYGYVGYAPMREAPADAYVIKTEGRMWEWEFFYPNGKSSEDLYVPIGVPVKLVMTTPDVIHSLYIPAFRVKEDLVPGKETELWFIAQQLGEYEVLCAEYCGLRHSYMESKAFVMPVDSFNVWVADYTKPKVGIDRGLKIMKKNACLGCHSLDGSKLVGPSLKALFNSKRKIKVKGKVKEILVDEAYLRRSIFQPNEELTDGYPPNLMQSYKGIVTEMEADTIINYIKTLN
jgi:cytochrome c oxidase subunit 2